MPAPDRAPLSAERREVIEIAFGLRPWVEIDGKPRYLTEIIIDPPNEASRATVAELLAEIDRLNGMLDAAPTMQVVQRGVVAFSGNLPIGIVVDERASETDRAAVGERPEE